MSPTTSKVFKRILLPTLIILIFSVTYYAWERIPIVSAYGAKALCSCTFITGSKPEDIIQEELTFPSILKIGTFSINYSDSSATGHVFGLARRKAIYREGLGCTFIAQIAEEEIRSQKFNLLKAENTYNPDTIAWPHGNKLPDSIPAGIDLQKLTIILDTTMADQDHRRVRAAMVIYDGQIIAEKYAPGYSQHSRFTGWSMCKSITNAMVGILVKQNRLDINKPANIKGWENDDRKNITLNHLLQASSGLEWVEDYTKPSGATRMLYRKKDMGLYAATFPLVHKPGEFFTYSGGTTNIISRIIRDEVGDETYYQFPYKELFHKIGIRSMVMEPDAGGTFAGSSYSFGTARDWARFGLLYYYDGLWNSERILPEGWVKYTTTPARSAPIGQYGAQWWLNAGAQGNPANRMYPDVPTDCYWANGYEGENVWVIPSKKLVVVRLSCEHENVLDENRFLADIISCLPE